MWFNNKKEDGARLPYVYKLFPKVALALILATVSFRVYSWFSFVILITFKHLPDWKLHWQVGRWNSHQYTIHAGHIMKTSSMSIWRSSTSSTSIRQSCKLCQLCFRSFTTRDGECLDSLLSTCTEHWVCSLNAKADPIEQPQRRAQSPSAYAVAMEEFKNGGFYGTDGDASQEV